MNRTRVLMTAQRFFLLLCFIVSLSIIASPVVMATDFKVKIPRGLHGKYYTKGTINGRHVNFVVDRTATHVVLNMREAERLGIQYLKGTPEKLTVSNQLLDSFTLYAEKVGVGKIIVPRVKVSVVVGSVPQKVVLGNSFLSRIGVRVNRGVLELKLK